MQWFIEQGFEVHVIANEDVDLPYCNKRYILSIERSPYKLNNIKAYSELKKISLRNNMP